MRIMVQDEAGVRKVKVQQSRVVPIGNRRSAAVVLLEKGGGGFIQFCSPIKKNDFESGELRPRAEASRHKNQMVTTVALSREALFGLYQALNMMFRG